MADNKELQDHIMRDDRRLDRIEEKIDRLSETVISLARAEEKLIALESDRTIINERLNKHSDRIDEVESKMDETAITVRVINRIFWIGVTVSAAAWAGQIFMNM